MRIWTPGNPFPLLRLSEHSFLQPALPAMAAFDLDQFTRRLIAEALFYDEEYGALGNLSLIDPREGKERFIASYVPEEGTFSIEEATDWEKGEIDEEVGYALAVDSREFAAYDTPEAAAEALLALAREHNLLPSITLLFEEDEVS
jgi:hypothetical protein